MIRVLRLIEYTYPDVEAMDRDMQHWTNGKHRFSENVTISSVTLPLEIMAPETDISGD